MKNESHTESYNWIDRFVFNSVRVLSRFISVDTISKPFWNRWKASMLDEKDIHDFLKGIKNVDDWAISSSAMVMSIEDNLKTKNESISKEEKIFFAKKISFFSHLGQWGCFEIDDTKKGLYLKSRDAYIQASEMLHVHNFKRISVPWEGKQLYGNLHLPGGSEHKKVPLVIIIHGMDDSKEEHFPTIEQFVEDGIACFCIDGPGQAEALFMDTIFWRKNFHQAIIESIDYLEEHYNNFSKIGLLGISWGGMWCYKVAAKDSRIKAIYDLGGPIDTHDFERIPFFLKSKFCQVLGIRKVDEIPDANQIFSLTNDDTLKNIKCAVRIVHGDQDPLVKTEDKIWLKNELQSNSIQSDISLQVYEKGDHCCTAQFMECRIDAIHFFKTHLN